MKFNNILVVLNPDNEKQYALARAVRLVKEQQNETKVKITTLLSVYDLSYEMSALLSSEETLIEMLYGTITTVSAWAKLFPRDIVEKYPYPKGKIYEDLYVISDYLKEVESVCVIDLGIYHYYRRPNSITLSNFNSKHYDFYDSMDHLAEVVQKDYSANTELDDAIIARLFIGSLHIFILISDSSKEEIVRIQRRIRPYLRRILKNKRINLKNKAIYLMLSLVPGLYYQFKKLKKPQ